jgi:hypothetical protein
MKPICRYSKCTIHHHYLHSILSSLYSASSIAVRCKEALSGRTTPSSAYIAVARYISYSLPSWKYRAPISEYSVKIASSSHKVEGERNHKATTKDNLNT